jgi:hypothetical protein
MGIKRALNTLEYIQITFTLNTFRIHLDYKDAKSMSKCKNWRRSAKDRDAWRRRIEEAKAHVGL